MFTILLLLQALVRAGFSWQDPSSTLIALPSWPSQSTPAPLPSTHLTTTTISPLSSVATPNKPDEVVKAFLTGALLNVRVANKAEECSSIDQSSFVEKTVRFLDNWKTAARVPTQDVDTTKQLLERLIQYQDVYRIIGSKPRTPKGTAPPTWSYPGNIVERIREMRSILEDNGITRGKDSRVLNALDVIFNDVCADTGNISQIPRTVQETVDTVLRGISEGST
ncbi:hypothetical protein PG995_007729 [Apiospora arundinis]